MPSLPSFGPSEGLGGDEAGHSLSPPCALIKHLSSFDEAVLPSHPFFFFQTALAIFPLRSAWEMLYP